MSSANVAPTRTEAVTIKFISTSEQQADKAATIQWTTAIGQRRLRASERSRVK